MKEIKQITTFERSVEMLLGFQAVFNTRGTKAPTVDVVEDEEMILRDKLVMQGLNSICALLLFWLSNNKEEEMKKK